MIGAILSASLAAYFNSAAYVTDIRRSQPPPWASIEALKQLAQSQQQVQRQLNTTNFGLLQLSRATAQAQLDQADAMLRKDTENQIARSQHNAAIIQIQIIDQQMKSAVQAH